jgi:hypothetical protein
MMAELSAFQVTTGTVTAIALDHGGQRIELEAVAGQVGGTLTLNQLLPDEDRTVGLSGLALAPGEHVTLNAVLTGTAGITSTFAFSVTSTISQTYGLSLQRSGGPGYAVFGSGGLELVGDSSVHVTIPDWVALDTIDLMVDHGQDGSVDEVQTAVNQAQVSAIEVSLDASTLRPGMSTKILIEVRDQYGVFIADGTPVTMTTDLGSVQATQSTTSGGLFEATLLAGSVPGTGTMTVQAGAVEVSVTFTVEDYRLYLPALMR